jgi:uncharacterized protein
VDYLVICTVALLASGLTFFSGFGLGTLLLPAFALFFPAEVAVALTAVVHLLNSLFKLLLVGRRANFKVAMRFGLPAVLAAFAGARLLVWLSELRPIVSYELAGRTFEVTPIKLAISILMLCFAALEVWPRFKQLRISPRYLPMGGLLTGFFGGLSGHQGALRSAFLVRAGLAKEAFVATGVVIAAVVDLTRLAVYSERFLGERITDNGSLLLAAVGAAFTGAFLGNRLLEKVTMGSIEVIVTLMLAAVAIGLGSGLL